jgi:hypothetical protein
MRKSSFLAIAAAAITVAACSSVQGGGGTSPVTGSAGATGNASGTTGQLVQCGQSVGTIALVESQIPALAQMGLTSPVPLIRLLAAQSRCFNVVERGQGLSRMIQERELSSGGLLQQGSNIGGGRSWLPTT